MTIGDVSVLSMVGSLCVTVRIPNSSNAGRGPHLSLGILD